MVTSLNLTWTGSSLGFAPLEDTIDVSPPRT